MSLPPETIQVKRKRSREGDEGSTVDFLRVERDNKRHRSINGHEHWVYQRKQPDVERPDTTLRPHRCDVIPVIQVSQPGDENRPAKSSLKPKQQYSPVDLTPISHGDGSSDPAVLTPRSAGSSEDNVRRFHLSRSSTPTRLGRVQHGAISRKRSAPALFIERGRKKHIGESSQLAITDMTESQNSLATAQGPGFNADIERNGMAVSSETKTSTRANKKPGAAASSTKKTGLPPSLLNRDAVDMDQLAKDMHEFALAQISQTLDEEMERDEKEAKAKADAAKRSKYRPKAPAKRFAERHPEYVAKWEQEQAAKAAVATVPDTAMDEGASDDDDYVLETYVRVPASRMPSNVAPNRVGLLVFDNEPDVEYFYGEEGDDDEEDDPDEDDENAENYYGADYPEEEMEWSDEMGLETRKYYNHNSAEYEFRGDRHWDSDEENEADPSL